LNRRFKWSAFLKKDLKIEEESNRILDLLDLQDVRGILAGELSYGVQRQLELALTLAMDPVFIMLDEPTAGLNTEESKTVVQLIRKVSEGKILLMVEHDMQVVFNMADRITVLNYGNILASGVPDEIRKSPEVRKAYLGRKSVSGIE
jgi:branched-chain amino acid transport system ATP-binding protein